MGLFFIHSEDNKWHIYRLRSIKLATLTLLLAIYSGIAFGLAQIGADLGIFIYPAYLFVVLIIIGIIEYIPMWYRRWKARIKGKTEIQKGGWFSGYAEVRIEK